MKRVLIFSLLAFAISCAGCSKDRISTTEEPVDTSAVDNDEPEGQLVFSGTGSLSVTATGKAGITSDDYLRFMGSQSITANSTAGHALRGKDAVRIDDGTLTLGATAAGKKGISSDGAVTINGGATVITVSGGTVAEQVTSGSSTTTEYTGSAGVKADSTFVMNAGTLSITNSGQGGKGISGDMQGIFAGGTVSVKVTGSNYGSSATKAGPGGGGWGPGGGGWGPGSGSSGSSKSAKGIKFDGDITRYVPLGRLCVRMVGRQRRHRRQRQSQHRRRHGICSVHQGLA